MNLISLPYEMVCCVQTYLTFQESHLLLNTSFKYFHDVKKRSLNLSLKAEQSAKFTSDALFRKRVLDLIQDPSKQLSLIYCDTIAQAAPEFPFDQLNQIKIVNCSMICHLSAMRDVPSLVIENCINIRDYSALGKQSSLSLINCPRLVSLENLANVCRLKLKDCPNIVDFTPLHNIMDLTIDNCLHLSDLSCLAGRHDRIAIIQRVVNWRRCSVLRGYEALQGIPHVYLKGCDIKDLSVLQNAMTVTLIYCYQICDAMPLRNVHNVRLYDCGEFRIKNLSLLKNVKDLVIDQPLTFSTYLQFANEDLKKFHKGNEAWKYPSPNPLSSPSVNSSVRRLTIDSYSFPIEVMEVRSELFSQLQHLCIQNCEEITHLPMVVGSIPSIRLESLPRLMDINVLGEKNRIVHIAHCPLIRDVSCLQNSLKVTIEDCKAIKSFDFLSKVGQYCIHIST